MSLTRILGQARASQPLTIVKVRDITPRGRDRFFPRFEVTLREEGGHSRFFRRTRTIELDVPTKLVLEPNQIEQQLRLLELCEQALKEQR